MWLEHSKGFVRLSAIESLVIQQSSTTAWYVEIHVAGTSVSLPNVPSQSAATQQARDIVAAQGSTVTI